CFDLVLGRTSFVGYLMQAATFTDAWSWDGTSMQQDEPGLDCGPLVYDSRRGVTLGIAPDGSGVFEWDGTRWNLRALSNGPSARSNYALAYDSLRSRVILCGGYANGWLYEPWEFDGQSWSTRPTGQQPSDRGTMAFDSARGRAVFYGGSTLDETWEWDG